MILDVLATSAMIGGALLAVLGAFGLLRFPDVFTRMHAATKAATLGVILITAAAALEAGAASGLLVLLLVIALLFLSGPLGISLLARAAYRDPETPRASTTRDLDVSLPATESPTLQRSKGTSPLLAVWLVLAWVALFGTARLNVLVSAIVVAGVTAFALRRLAPRWPHAFLHPVKATRFAVHFTGQLITSTWDVIRLLFRRTEALEPAIIEVPVLVRTRNEATLLMNAISFTPGTVALELHADRLYVHMLSTKPTREIVAEINVLQRLIADAFGPHDRGRNVYHASDDV